jgi:EAL and modified HD-GYP domain-containing signal transduction protein
MLSNLLKRWFGGAKAANRSATDDFAALNQQAPIKAKEAASERDPGHAQGFICRETILGRDQRVAAYHFQLHEGTRNRLALRSRRIHHVYAEVVVRNLIKMDVAKLLGHRLAFFELPDSFLHHEALDMLPPASVVLNVVTLPDAGGPAPAAVIERIRALKQTGIRFAADALSNSAPGAYLLAEADFVIVQTDRAEPRRLRDLADGLKSGGSQRQWLARELPSHDEFTLCFNLGAQLFQGPFITRREDWSGNSLGPNSARIADLMSQLRRDVELNQMAELLKQDPALSLRLMRYINSAAIGIREEITSIERALMQLGRDKLYRWLSLLLYGADSGNSGASALLESALVRARMLELLGASRPASEREALFLVGLLSLVDAVLKVPMETALTQLSASPEIEAAVARGEGPMAALLRLAIACEGTDASALTLAAEQCGVTAEDATEAHLQALGWALEVTRE